MIVNITVICTFTMLENLNLEGMSLLKQMYEDITHTTHLSGWQPKDA